MKKALTALFLSLLLTFSAIFTSVSAVDNRLQYLVDEADLLSSDEAESLSKLLFEISKEYGINIVIVTTPSLNGSTPENFADDFYDNGGYGEDGILLLISMEFSDWYISTAGYGITVVTDAGREYMKDGFIDDLSNGEYYSAFVSYAELCESFIIKANNGDPYDSHNIKAPFGFFKNLLISAAIGFVISFIITLIMKGKLKTVRFNDSAVAYIKNGTMNVTKSRDTYLYSHVTKIPKPTDSGGGSRTHTSSSGRIHGGGGGKF